MSLRRLRLAEPEDVVAQPLGQREELLRDPASRLVPSSPAGCVEPEPPQRLKQLAGLSDLLAQLARSGVRSADVRRAETLRRVERRPEPEEQPQLLSHLLTRLWQSRDEIQPLR